MSRKFRMPVGPQTATTMGAMAIGFGFVIGTAISPGVQTLGAVAPSFVSAPAPAPAPVSDTAGPTVGGDGGGSSSPGDFVASTSDTGTLTTSGGGGADHKSKKKSKKKKKKDQASMTLIGAVVHTNPGASSYAVAAGGELQAIHAPDLPGAGDYVKVQLHKLRNGTFAQDGQRTAQGTVQTSAFSGVVTYRDERARVYTVSSRGSSVLVHVPATGAGEIPPLASTVMVSVTIGAPKALVAPSPPDPATATPVVPLLPLTPAPTAPTPSPCDADGELASATPPPASVSPLDQTAVTIIAPRAPTADLEAIVQAVCPASGELVVSADDLRESFMDVTLKLPSTIDATKLAPGQLLSIGATIDAADLFTISRVAGDQGQAAADDAAQAQG